MITPKFTLSQDDEYVTAVIYAPYVRAQDVEICFDDSEFTFFCKPYYLRLNFGGHLIVEDGREKARYDVDAHEFVINIPKQTPGEIFQDLNLLTKLLTPAKPQECMSPMIEELDVPLCELDGVDDAHSGAEEEFSWYIDQHPNEGDSEEVCLGSLKYGFANKVSGIWIKLSDYVSELVDLKDPDDLTSAQRRALQNRLEIDHFSEDHYLFDLYENCEIESILEYSPTWLMETISDIHFTSQDKDRLMAMPKRSYLLSATEERMSYLALIDLVFAFCYNDRITKGEENVESHWNIRKVCATLSCLATYDNVLQVVHSCVRRSLCYPLVRHWEVSMKVLDDVNSIFSKGKQFVVRCLLEIHRMFSVSEPYYIFNDLYITDLCVWVQRATQQKMQSLCHAVASAKPSKGDLDLGLLVLEQAASLALECSDSETPVSELSASNTSSSETSASGVSDSESNVSDAEPLSASCSGARSEECDSSEKTSLYAAAACRLDESLIDPQIAAAGCRMANLVISPKPAVEKKLIMELPPSS